MTDGRSLSRRKLLWAVATVGAAASTGSGAAALLNDSESLGESTVSAGVVDLKAEPSWGNDDSLGTISNGESGRRTVELTLVDNPSYVWFRTECEYCTDVEEALYVRYGVDTDGDGDVDLPITDGYIPLGEAREQYGTGYHLGTLDPSETWTLIADWELRQPVEGTDVPLSFDFYAVQTRHIPDPGRITLPWSCVPCGGPSGDPSGDLSGISWVAFCGVSTFETDFTPALDGDHTLLLDTDAYTVSEDIDTIAIKYGQTIEVFDYTGQSSLTVGQGDGDVYQHVGGDEYEGTTRSSSNFCDGAAGCKFEFDEDEWVDCVDEVVSNGTGSTGNNANVGPDRLVDLGRWSRDPSGGDR